MNIFKEPVKLFEAISHLAVVIGLIFLIFELKQSNDMIKVQTRALISETLISVSMAFSSKDISNAFSKPMNMLTPTECYQLYGFSRGMFRAWENQHYQHLQGFFDETEYSAALKSWEQLLHWDKFRMFWKNQRKAYAPKFQAIIDHKVKVIEHKIKRSQTLKQDKKILPKNYNMSLCDDIRHKLE